MAENVIILGAGASAESGAPLMNNFLDISEDLYSTKSYGKNAEAIEFIFQILSRLQSVYAKSFLDLNNIESVFGIIDMGNLILKLGDLSTDEIISAKDSIITLIVKTLELKTQFPIEQSNGRQVGPTESYNRFVEMLNEQGIDKFSCISFNYDIALDFALYKNRLPINYCLDAFKSEGIKYLKLHGSINWGYCNECNEIIPYYFNDFFKKYNFSNAIHSGSKHAVINISEHLNDLSSKHKHNKINDAPVIVPPTWNKGDYQKSIQQVWFQAADELSNAKNIFVIGYSLPESDTFFKYLFSLGTMGDSRIRRFNVFDPDKTGIIQKRFENLLGRGITDRYRYYSLKFKDAITELNTIFTNK